MVHLAFFNPDDFPGINYVLNEDQLRFTASVEQALENIKARNGKEAFPIIILEDENPAGFFVLDFGKDKLDMTDNEHAVLIRSLSVNPDMQGRGIGKEAMMKVDDFIRKHFENCNEVVLAVNEKNKSAYHLYTRTGYSYDGKTRAGRSGIQYLMYKKL